MGYRTSSSICKSVGKYVENYFEKGKKEWYRPTCRPRVLSLLDHNRGRRANRGLSGITPFPQLKEKNNLAIDEGVVWDVEKWGNSGALHTRALCGGSAARNVSSSEDAGRRTSCDVGCG